jgi:hypothetical protein
MGWVGLGCAQRMNLQRAMGIPMVFADLEMSGDWIVQMPECRPDENTVSRVPLPYRFYVLFGTIRVDLDLFGRGLLVLASREFLFYVRRDNS